MNNFKLYRVIVVVAVVVVKTMEVIAKQVKVNKLLIKRKINMIIKRKVNNNNKKKNIY